MADHQVLAEEASINLNTLQKWLIITKLNITEIFCLRQKRGNSSYTNMD